MAAEVGKPKREVKRLQHSQTTVDTVFEKYNQSMETLLDVRHMTNMNWLIGFAELKADAVEFYVMKIRKSSQNMEMLSKKLPQSHPEVVSLDRHLRPDGCTNEIRPIWCGSGCYPRVDGNGFIYPRRNRF